MFEYFYYLSNLSIQFLWIVRNNSHFKQCNVPYVLNHIDPESQSGFLLNIANSSIHFFLLNNTFFYFVFLFKVLENEN